MSSIASSPTRTVGPGRPRLWQNLWVRFAVALAFADASIVVLALPQIVDRLHTSIDHSTWVIMAYNLALIVTSALVATVGRRLRSAQTLVGGLVLFGAASIGCGASGSVGLLVALRCVQGVGGALVLASSLPLFAGAARPGDSPLHGWSAAAAVGAALGPAAGGVLTQLFDWRSIFYAQAPFAAIAAVAVLLVRHETRGEMAAEADRPAFDLGPLSANLALLLLSGALIGALLLVTIELIHAWVLTPIATAAVVSVIPLSTALTERLVRGRSTVGLGVTGAILLAAGLIGLGFIAFREVGLVVVALVACGAGLGLAYPGLTAVALESGGTSSARAAKTVAARDLGLVVGLLVLTPVFSTRLNAVTSDQTPEHKALAALIASPLPGATKLALGVRLEAALASAGQTNVPNVRPAFDQTAQTATPAVRLQLAVLERQMVGFVHEAQRKLTRAFRRPFLYAAIFALAVLPVLALGVFQRRRGGFAERPRPAASA